MARRAARRAGGATEADQPQQADAQPEPPPATSSDDQLADLQKLSDLHEEGALTDEEFETQKQKILAAM